jgi:hypothetical protein
MQSAGKEFINQLSNFLYFELLRTFLINVFTHENRNLVTKMYFFQIFETSNLPGVMENRENNPIINKVTNFTFVSYFFKFHSFGMNH